MQALFIRHGEPDYSQVEGLTGHGRDLAPLTAEGIEQAEKAAEDPRLADAELMLVSPYARAMHTGAIILRENPMPIVADYRLHEWLPSVGMEYSSVSGCDAAFREYYEHDGIQSDDCVYDWEEAASIRERVDEVMAEYVAKGYEKILVVCHGEIIRTMLDSKDLVEYCAIESIEF